MNIQKANEKSLFGKNMTFKNLTKVSGGFELRMCSSEHQCPRPLRYDNM